MKWEVRVMKFSNQISDGRMSGWFNGTLLKKNITRFWPLWVGYIGVLAFLLPMELFLELSRMSLNGSMGFARDTAWSIVNDATIGMLSIGVVYGLLLAMLLFSYLMNSRAAGMYHALPIRREGIFLTNWLTGLLVIVVPAVVVFFAAVMVEAGAGVLALGDLLQWLVTAIVCPMFFFCLATCVAMFTGHILALPVFYGIVNCLVIGICALMDYSGNRLLYNYDSAALVDSTLARWCTPAYQLYYLLTEGGSSVTAVGVTAVAGFSIVLGLTFTLIAVVTYQNRQLERAGDIVTVGWVRPVFQYGVGICSGLLFGIFFFENFFSFTGWRGYVALSAVSAVLGAFVGRMLLNKTLRVFADRWKGCCALGLAMVLVMVGVHTDLLGYQRWLPDVEQVVGVRVWGVQNMPYDDGDYLFQLSLKDEESIQKVFDLHKALNDDMDELREFADTNDYWGLYSEDGGYQLMDTNYVTVEYTLKNGNVVKRSYSPLPVWAEKLDDEGWTGQLNRFINEPDIIWKSYLQNFDSQVDVDTMKVSDGWLENARETETAAQETYQTEQFGFITVDTEISNVSLDNMTAQAAQEIWAAFREDIAAGRVKRYLIDSAERRENCYITDICIVLTWTELDENGERFSQSQDVTFTPQKSQTSVMEVLEKYGLKDYLIEWEE